MADKQESRDEHQRRVRANGRTRRGAALTAAGLLLVAGYLNRNQPIVGQGNAALPIQLNMEFDSDKIAELANRDLSTLVNEQAARRWEYVQTAEEEREPIAELMAKWERATEELQQVLIFLPAPSREKIGAHIRTERAALQTSIETMPAKCVDDIKANLWDTLGRTIEEQHHARP